MGDLSRSLPSKQEHARHGPAHIIPEAVYYASPRERDAAHFEAQGAPAPHQRHYRQQYEDARGLDSPVDQQHAREHMQSRIIDISQDRERWTPRTLAHGRPRYNDLDPHTIPREYGRPSRVEPYDPRTPALDLTASAHHAVPHTASHVGWPVVNAAHRYEDHLPSAQHSQHSDYLIQRQPLYVYR